MYESKKQAFKRKQFGQMKDIISNNTGDKRLVLLNHTTVVAV